VKKFNGAIAALVAVAVVFFALLCTSSQARADQASEAVPGLKYIPGKPWTRIIPDPDVYQWQPVASRPGYRYRGMLPMHQRFYDYIQAKRAAGRDLSWADQAMIRWLQSLRRWPEAPAPNELSRAFMKYLRNLDREQLNFAESLMYSQIVARGYLPHDPQPNETQRRLIEYLSSGPFQPRNWFERTFGRVEPWIEQYLVSQGYSVDRPSAGGPTFPGEPFNGMQISYSISGALPAFPEDKYDFHTRRIFRGVLPAGTLTISGVARMGSGFGADLTVEVWAGAKREKFAAYIKSGWPGFNSQPFSLSVPVPKGTDAGGFIIRMDGHYSMGGGWRGLSVEGYFERDAAEKRAELDAAWRQKVEETLAKLGYEDTPEGRAVKELRDAVEGGDAAWKAYVDRQLAALGYEDTPDGKECQKLAEAVEQGGAAWDAYVAENGGTGAPGAGQQQTGGQVQQAGGGQQPTQTADQGTASLPDVGGLKVGTATDAGTLGGVADHFPSTPRLATVFEFQDLDEETIFTCVWSRDGKEIARNQRKAIGSGWVSFQIYAQDGSSLPEGRYTVTILRGDQVVGRKTITIGK